MKTATAKSLPSFTRILIASLCLYFFAGNDSGADTVFVSTGEGVSVANANGVVTVFSNSSGGASGLAVDASGNVYAASSSGNAIWKYNPSGQGSVFANVQSPTGLVFDSNGNLCVSTWIGTASGSILKFNSSGQSTVFASGSNLHFPSGLAFDSAGNLYVANTANDYISKFDSGGNGSFFSFTGSRPFGLAFDSSGSLYAACAGGNGIVGSGPSEIDKFNSSGQREYAPSGVLGNNGLAFDSQGYLYVTGQVYLDAGSPFPVIYKIDANGNGSIFATGSRGDGFYGIAIVPEPSSFAVMALGIVALCKGFKLNSQRGV